MLNPYMSLIFTLGHCKYIRNTLFVQKWLYAAQCLRDIRLNIRVVHICIKSSLDTITRVYIMGLDVLSRIMMKKPSKIMSWGSQLGHEVSRPGNARKNSFLLITFEAKVVTHFCFDPSPIIWPLRISQNLNELCATKIEEVRLVLPHSKRSRGLRTLWKLTNAPQTYWHAYWITQQVQGPDKYNKVPIEAHYEGL